MKKALFIAMFVLFFLLGFLSSLASSYFAYQKQELQKLQSSLAIERQSPSDFISPEQIEVLDDKVIINIKKATWSSYADTNSMDPLIDENSNGIEVVPVCEDIKTGDIIVYRSSTYGDYIVHRVKSIDFDDTGRYFRLKGDNNPALDPEKVRCDQIKYQIIGILY